MKGQRCESASTTTQQTAHARSARRLHQGRARTARRHRHVRVPRGHQADPGRHRGPGDPGDARAHRPLVGVTERGAR